MRRIVVVLALVSSFAASGARAADIPNARPTFKAPALPPLPGHDWSGFYLGGQIGYGWGNSSGTQNAGGTFFPVVPYTIDPRGVLGGGHAGYNYQVNSVVLGIEGDVEAANVNDLGRVSSTNSSRALADLGATDDNRLAIHAVRAGLSYRFNPH